jgi:hypothetical protein
MNSAATQFSQQTFFVVITGRYGVFTQSDILARFCTAQHTKNGINPKFVVQHLVLDLTNSCCTAQIHCWDCVNRPVVTVPQDFLETVWEAFF